MSKEVLILAVLAFVLGLSFIIRMIAWRNRDHKSHLVTLLKEEDMFFCPGIDARCDAEER